MAPDPAITKLLAERAEQVSGEIQGLLHGLGMRTQGAILADLVSMWLAGMFAESEVARSGPLSQFVRREMFDEWCELVRTLVPESERQLLQRVDPQGRA